MTKSSSLIFGLTFWILQGRINIDEEIEKAQKKLDKNAIIIERQEKLMSAKDYKTKVKASVQETEAAKLADAKAESETLSSLIAKLEKLRAWQTWSLSFFAM